MTLTFHRKATVIFISVSRHIFLRKATLLTEKKIISPKKIPIPSHSIWSQARRSTDFCFFFLLGSYTSQSRSRPSQAAFTRIRIDPDIRMSQLRIGLPSTRKRLKCTLSGAIRYAIRSCSKTISKVDHPDVPVLFGDSDV